jgi:hypothetical protein
MARENPVFQVLVASGNQGLLAADKALSELGVGQIGIFNAETNVSVDNTSIATTKDIYIAVGIDRNGDGVVDDVIKSAGQLIQKRNMTALNMQCPVAAVPKEIDITDFKAMCETTYAVKLTLSNQEGYLTNGFTPLSKTFVIKTSCCSQTDCVSCPQGDCREVAIEMVKAINNDPDKIVEAFVIDPDGVILEGSDLEDWINDEENEGVCLGIRIKAYPLAIQKFCSINHKYFNPRNTDLEVSLVEGFNCNGTVTVNQEMEVEQGAGYDIAQLEYEAGGWNGKPGPYRQSAISGLATESFESYVNQSASYVVYNLVYDQESVGGWLEYKNNLNTIIAVPATGTSTISALSGRLNAWGTGFTALPTSCS